MNSYVKEGTFLYFGYGSNLLKKRISLSNPTAEFLTIGRLDGYKLGFDNSSDGWCGATATIIPATSGEHVWGAVWRMNNSDLPNIDKQEGVDSGIYEAIRIEVKTPDLVPLSCRSYKLLRVSSADKRPSPHYLDVIVRGAQEIALPGEYINTLKSIEHNGYKGSVVIYDRLKLNQDPNVKPGIEFTF